MAVGIQLVRLPTLHDGCSPGKPAVAMQSVCNRDDYVATVMQFAVASKRHFNRHFTSRLAMLVY